MDTTTILNACERWKIKPPQIVQRKSLPNWGRYGECVSGRSLCIVHVDPSRCKHEGYGTPRDCTVQGVLAHELGHVVHNWFGIRPHKPSPLKEAWKHLHGVETVGYEPDHYESFAETMKLFITNPDLLRLGAPRRFTFILSLGLTPLHHLTWRDVASDHKICEDWLTRAV